MSCGFLSEATGLIICVYGAGRQAEAALTPYRDYFRLFILFFSVRRARFGTFASFPWLPLT